MKNIEVGGVEDRGELELYMFKKLYIAEEVLEAMNIGGDRDGL